jgi:hypothetical protein
VSRHRCFRRSVLAGNTRTRCDAIKIDLSLDSDEPAERVAQLIKMAEATCFTLAALHNPTLVALEATVKGQPFDPEGKLYLSCRGGGPFAGRRAGYSEEPARRLPSQQPRR